MSEQFWIMGADGREYGPVPLETVSRWIGEGRVVPGTQVRTETSGPTEARLRPELAAFFASAPSAPSVPPHAGAAVWPAGVPAEFHAWDFIGRAWELVKPHWLPLAGIIFIQFAITCVPYLGGCAQLIIGGAIQVGIWRAMVGLVDGRAPTVGMMFEGFDRFGDAFLAYLVSGILIGLGLLCLIVPGIILALMWMFTFPVLGETGIGFWEAMHRSAVLTEGYRWRLFLLWLACLLVLLLGLVAFCVGIFVAAPVCYTALALAYRYLRARKDDRTAAA